MFGISPKSLDIITEALQSVAQIERVVIFGSRAMGNHKPGSDIDIAIFGANVTTEITLNLNATLNEKLPLPYYFDVVNYNTINEPALKKHIDELGKVLSIREQA